MTQPYLLLADAVLVIHLGVVAFVVGGLAAILIGNLRDWGWVNGWWFRAAHLAAIAVVAAEAWLGLACPLTTLEAWLRDQGGAPIHAESFVGYWVQRLLFYRAPWWVFALAYSAFAGLVILAWWRFPPRRNDVRTDMGRPAGRLRTPDDERAP